MDGKCRQKHRNSCQYQNLTALATNCAETTDQKPTVTAEKSSNDDFKFNYVCNILRDGLMDWCRENSTKENDGDRLFHLQSADC